MSNVLGEFVRFDFVEVVRIKWIELDARWNFHFGYAIEIDIVCLRVIWDQMSFNLGGAGEFGRAYLDGWTLDWHIFFLVISDISLILICVTFYCAARSGLVRTGRFWKRLGLLVGVYAHGSASIAISDRWVGFIDLKLVSVSCWECGIVSQCPGGGLSTCIHKWNDIWNSINQKFQYSLNSIRFEAPPGPPTHEIYPEIYIN